MPMLPPPVTSGVSSSFRFRRPPMSGAHMSLVHAHENRRGQRSRCRDTVHKSGGQSSLLTRFFNHATHRDPDDRTEASSRMGLSLSRYLHLKLLETDELRQMHGRGMDAQKGYRADSRST